MNVSIETQPKTGRPIWLTSENSDSLLRKLTVECKTSEIKAVARNIENYCIDLQQPFVDLQVQNWESPIWDDVYAALPATFRYAVHLDDNKNICGRSIVYKRDGFRFPMGQ